MDLSFLRWLAVAEFAMHGFAMAGAAAYSPWSIRGEGGDSVGASWLFGGGGLALASWRLIAPVQGCKAFDSTKPTS